MTLAQLEWKPEPYLYDDPELVDSFDLSTRTYNALKKHGIRTVDELKSHHARELLRIPEFGRKALNEVIEQLKKRGLKLATDFKE